MGSPWASPACNRRGCWGPQFHPRAQVLGGHPLQAGGALAVGSSAKGQARGREEGSGDKAGWNRQPPTPASQLLQCWDLSRTYKDEQAWELGHAATMIHTCLLGTPRMPLSCDDWPINPPQAPQTQMLDPDVSCLCLLCIPSIPPATPPPPVNKAPSFLDPSRSSREGNEALTLGAKFKQNPSSSFW